MIISTKKNAENFCSDKFTSITLKDLIIVHKFYKFIILLN
ncbi:hypothetical protein ABIB50_000531 [Mucilaginibacter sp. UYCu711]